MRKYVFFLVMLSVVLSLAVFFVTGIGIKSEEYIAKDETFSGDDEKDASIREGISTRQEEDFEKEIRSGNEIVEKKHSKYIDNEIPFTAQAPLAQWSDLIFQNGCEEASLLMAERFAKGIDAPFEPNNASEAIQNLHEFEEELFGKGQYDLSAFDTARVAREILNFDAQVYEVDSTQESIDTIQAGAIAIVPINGQLLDNPHFTPPGPLYHMLLIRGYDPETDEFITNDPGTRYGEGYRYASETLFGAMHDYETGYHGEIFPERKVMVVVYPKKDE